MKLTILGATGPTGIELVKQGLALGHDVTVLVRNPDRMPIEHPALRLSTGDARDEKAVDAAIEGQEAVLCALGPRARAGSAATTSDVVSIAVGHAIASMTKRGLRRLVYLSSVAVGESRWRLQAGFALGLVQEAVLVSWMLRNEFRDKEKAEQLIRASDLDWVLVQPTKLVDGKSRKLRVRTDGGRVGWLYSTTSRIDVATFMLQQIESDRYLRQAPVIGS